MEVKQDLERIRAAYAALKVKEQADQSLRGDALEMALELYDKADEATKQEKFDAFGIVSVPNRLENG